MKVFAEFENTETGVIIKIPMGYEKANDLMGLNKRHDAYEKLAQLMGDDYTAECVLNNEWDETEDEADGVWLK